MQSKEKIDDAIKMVRDVCIEATKDVDLEAPGKMTVHELVCQCFLNLLGSMDLGEVTCLVCNGCKVVFVGRQDVDELCVLCRNTPDRN